MIYELKGKYSNVNAIKINAILKTVFKTIKSYTEKSSFEKVYCIIFKYGTILICVADLKSIPPNLFLLENYLRENIMFLRTKRMEISIAIELICAKDILSNNK